DDLLHAFQGTGSPAAWKARGSPPPWADLKVAPTKSCCPALQCGQPSGSEVDGETDLSADLVLPLGPVVDDEALRRRVERALELQPAVSAGGNGGIELH